MKRTFITFLIVVIGVVNVSAQQVKMEYDDKALSLPEVMQQYFRIKGVQCMSATMKGDFNGKRGRIKRISCHNGEFSEKEMMSEFIHFVLTDSVETLDFMAVPIDDGKMLLECVYPVNGQQMFSDTLDIDKSKILMETYTADDDAAFPILAYSSGIKIDSEIGSMIWFCGLRDSGVAPRKWRDEHGIDDYVYYTVTLEEDTPPGDNDPVYVKVAKEGSEAFHRH